jgi:hypothetical protein
VANTRTTTSSRKPSPAARAASRPSTAREADVDEAEVSAADAQEIEAEGHYVTALLRHEDRSEELRIIPPGAWRLSWQRLLSSGQIDAFADLVLHPDDYDVFVDADPTNEEFGEFIADAAEQAGESLGKSRGPAPSSRRTRRR